jgi:hypothetical protein
MATERYHKAKIGEHELKPETLMLGYGYDPKSFGRVRQAAGRASESLSKWQSWRNGAPDASLEPCDAFHIGQVRLPTTR